MSDDEDYMSDKFLQGSEKYTPPSLIHKHSDKRELEIMKRKAAIEAKLREKNKSLATLETEKRERGLSAALESSNKGFEMLMKMGYKPGQGIGKGESGIVEPLSVELKSNRQGLGKKTTTAVKKKPNENSNSQVLDNAGLTSFRDRIAQKKAEQSLKIDLYKSQKVCEQLDIKNKIEKPQENWFWVNVKLEEEETKEDEEDDKTSTEDSSGSSTEEESLDNNEKLEILTKYLREKYYYCIWCGTAYQDKDDLRDSCPGSSRGDH